MSGAEAHLSISEGDRQGTVTGPCSPLPQHTVQDFPYSTAARPVTSTFPTSQTEKDSAPCPPGISDSWLSRVLAASSHNKRDGLTLAPKNGEEVLIASTCGPYGRAMASRGSRPCS